MLRIPRRDSLPRHGRRAALPLLALLLLTGWRAAEDPRPADPPEGVADEAALRERLDGWRRGGRGVQVLEPLLAARVSRLRQDSPSFDRAWRDLEARGTPVVIGTREQLHDVLPAEIRRSDAWAGITVTWGGGRLERSAVGIRLEWLRGLHASFGNPESAFLEAVDGLLIHEVYGHLVPVVQAGTPRERCGDPGPRERLADSCVGRRELALKQERREHVAARLAAADAATPPH